MSEVCVRVAVRIRPLLPKEVLHNHQVCVRVVPGSEQVMLGSDRLFSFDHAFGPTASQDEVYESCVRPLVESLVDGYNATVFCYGQTGSGKTHTLGGGNLDDEGGVIDHVAQDVFLFLGEKMGSSDGVEATVRVSYMELYGEELRDLLELHTIHKELHIREDERGNTVVVGAKEVVVTSAEELLSVLETGNALRHAGTTGMNDHSSRSHAILTLQLVQSCHKKNSSLKSVRSSKLCLVDLAGSERVGKTGNTGTRLKESVLINTGLLALGNVIRALSDPVRNRRGNNCNSAHIPYRDAKITRLLRDSLGGTAHTLMVACVSPSHHSVAETLSVMQFASKARHIRNRPGATSTHTEAKTCPTSWDPGEARLGELEYEVQTLRELLKEKEREVEMKRERAAGRGEEGDSFKQPSQMRISDPDKKMNQEVPSQYRLLAQEAAALLANIPGPAPSHSFTQRLQDWQERLTAVSHSRQDDDKGCSEGDGDQPLHVTILKLREELNKCKEALTIEEQLLEQKDAELRQAHKEVEKLLQQSETHRQAFEEEKERSRIQTEHLVDQQILISRLRSDLMTFRGATSGATVEAGAYENLSQRPHSVPLIRHSCVHGPPRRIHSSPPAYSLERVMAAFKMRGHLLLAEIEEKDEVYCPFIKQQAEAKDRVQEKEEDILEGKMGFRRSLNRTWTSRQKKSALKEKKSGLDQASNGNSLVQQHQQATGTKDTHAKQSQMRKARLRTSVTQRRIRDLSVNMRMKEELIKELDKTVRETQAADRHGRHSGESREADMLARLSMQSQQVKAEVYRSLQHMRLQRAQLQTSLRQQRETSDNNQELDQNGEQVAGDLIAYKSNNQEESKEKMHESSWLEEEEEWVLQKRAELQEVEEELRRREEVIVHREACLQQKNKLEIKMLRSSQALSQDLLHVSMQLESLEEKLQSSSSVRQTGGITIEELEKERVMLKKRRDTLDAQLKDNRVLTVEEEHSLLQLEEAIEALDAALEFKNRSIQDKQKKLIITDCSSHRSQSTEPAQLCDVIRKLKELTTPEASELLVKYFNKVVCLRERERHLRLRCEELELHAGEQEAVVREFEVAMQRLALDADRRLTQQHRDHQSNIQLLLQKLKVFLFAMASSAMITVPTTASRFALLQIDSDSDSDASDAGKTITKGGRDSSGKPRQGKAGAAGGKAAHCNDKKKDKKKKKKEQQQTEANELRNLAFKKIPQKSCAPPPCMTLSGIAGELLSPTSGDHNIPAEGWQQWKQRDEQMTSELYEADLEKALILSKLEFEQNKQHNNTNASSPKSRGGKEGGGKKEKKKNQQAKDKKTVSLQDFQAEGSAEHLSRKQEKEDTRAANVALAVGQEERFFNKLEDDVSRIVQQEKRREQYSNSQGQEVSTSTEHEPDPRAEQLKYELEKKDQEILKLKKTISQWEVKYKEVKARNSQLLKMLQQGEMKDKAEILLHVEELLHIKEELSSQVTLLHAALEQERSKVKGLQSDQPKHQGNKKGKKGSETDL